MPIGAEVRAGVPVFTHDVEVGILVGHGLGPLGHGHFLVVEPGVYPETVQAGIFYPPHGPLLEVLEHVGVIQVHVRHSAGEPALFHHGQVGLGSIGIQGQGHGVVGVYVRFVHVHPILERKVFHPPVLRAGVVGNHVHDYLDALGMGGIHQFLIFLVGAVTGVDVIVVGAGIAVVGTVAGVVAQQRRAPESRGAQIGNVVQVVDDALEVTAMAAHRLLPAGLFSRVGRRVNGGVSIGKTVGDDEIDKVCAGETFPLGASFGAFVNLIGITHGNPVFLEYERVGARLGLVVNLQVNEQVIGAVGLVHCLDIHAGGAFQGNIGLADILSVHQQLQLGVHSGPPAKGFDLLDNLLSVHGSNGTKDSANQSYVFFSNSFHGLFPDLELIGSEFLGGGDAVLAGNGFREIGFYLVSAHVDGQQTAVVIEDE